MPRALTLVDDLLFLSRIREAARGAGVQVRPVRQASDLVALVRDDTSLVLVDADGDRLPWAECIRALRAEMSPGAVPVVAFVSHVHADRAERARAAGCDRVLGRGAFIREMPRLLATVARNQTPQEESTP